MRTVYFIRHAKSSWDDISLSDHDRPLNQRGKNDARKMGEYFLENGHNIEIMVSSSAKRAKSTAKKINEVIKSENMIIEPRLYLASAREIMQAVRNIHNEVNSAALVAHNPGMTDLANMFSDDRIYNVPTTGVFKIDFEIEDWGMAEISSGVLDFFIYPKMLDDV
ncbi:MAG: SixA phosphatase family protein [Deltaproteobacteria bacterium]